MQGLGFDVLAAILRHTAPSHVVTLATCIASKDLPQGKFWSLPTTARMHEGASVKTTLLTLPALPAPNADAGRLHSGIAHSCSMRSIYIEKGHK